MAGSHEMFEKVIDVVEGRLQGDDAAAVLAMVAREPEWAEAHRWLTRVADPRQGVRLAAVPPTTRAMLEELLPAPRTVVDDLKDVWRSVARLVTDRPAGLAFAGARGAVGTSRQVHFATTEGIDVVLDLDVADQQLAVGGVVLGIAATHVDVRHDGGSATVEVDSFGEFRLVVPTTTFLRLDLVAAGASVAVDLTEVLDAEH